MAIVLACSRCRVTLTAPDSAAGRKVKCPKCGQVVRMLSSSLSAAAPSSANAIQAEEAAHSVFADLGAELPTGLRPRPAKRPAARGQWRFPWWASGAAGMAGLIVLLVLVFAGDNTKDPEPVAQAPAPAVPSPAPAPDHPRKTPDRSAQPESEPLLKEPTWEPVSKASAPPPEGEPAPSPKPAVPEPKPSPTDPVPTSPAKPAPPVPDPAPTAPVPSRDKPKPGPGSGPDKPGQAKPVEKSDPAKEKPPARPGKKDPLDVPGYKHKVIERFHVLIHEDVVKNNEDARWARKPPLAVLEYELGLINRMLPQRFVNVLRKVPVWAEWDDENEPQSRAVAKYYGVFGTRALWDMKDPRKANSVDIVRMKALTAEHQPSRESGRCVLFHEFAHAVHFHFFGPESPLIKATYKQAMDRNLYQGKYAAKNEHEYFAELSCAYFDKLNYEPRDRGALKKYDSAGYQMMMQTWGTPAQLEKELKADADKAARKLLSTAKDLRAARKTDEARQTLEKLIGSYPESAESQEAKKLLDQIE